MITHPDLLQLDDPEIVVRQVVAMAGRSSGPLVMNQGAVFTTRAHLPPESHRLVLWRIWGESLPLVVIGLNPSTATELVVDRTVNRCINYAVAEGCGGLIMLNIFSYRATDPNELKQYVSADWNEIITGGYANDQTLLWHTDPVRAGLVLAGWGADGVLMNRGRDVAKMLRDAGRKLHCLKETGGGHPGHPLYLSKSLRPVPYETMVA